MYIIPLKWDSDVADFGWDFVLWSGVRVDVKGSAHPLAKCLIWPASKIELFEEKRFDILVFVWADMQKLGRCEVRGWISKEEFKRRRIVATDDSRFINGTWFLHETELNRIAA